MTITRRWFFALLGASGLGKAKPKGYLQYTFESRAGVSRLVSVERMSADDLWSRATEQERANVVRELHARLFPGSKTRFPLFDPLDHA